MINKGIILAGGFGTRLYPLTCVLNKQLLPVYDKPMIYYPLSTLMLAGIYDVLIISREEDSQQLQAFLKDGEQWGIKIQYAVQEHPKGLPDAFIIGEKFIGDDPVAMILGDNIFHAEGLSGKLKKAREMTQGAKIFASFVNDPSRFGVVQFDSENNIISIQEKPKKPKSSYAITGLYFFDAAVVEYAKTLSPSKRNELEIVDLINIYHKQNKLDAIILGRGHAWLDTGTHEALLEAGNFVSTLERRQGLKISCPEEIAFRHNLINANQLLQLAELCKNTEYSRYLKRLLDYDKFYLSFVT